MHRSFVGSRPLRGRLRFLRMTIGSEAFLARETTAGAKSRAAVTPLQRRGILGSRGIVRIPCRGVDAAMRRGVLRLCLPCASRTANFAQDDTVWVLLICSVSVFVVLFP